MGRHNSEAKKAYRKRQKLKNKERKHDFLRGKNYFCNVLASKLSTDTESLTSPASTCDSLSAPSVCAKSQNITVSDTLSGNESECPDADNRSSVTKQFPSEQHSQILESEREKSPAAASVKKTPHPLYMDPLYVRWQEYKAVTKTLTKRAAQLAQLKW